MSEHHAKKEVVDPVVFVGGYYGRNGDRGMFYVGCAGATDAYASRGSRLQELRDLRKNLLGAFSIPEGQRAELGAIVDGVAEKLLREGALTEEIRNDLFNRLYSSGVVTEAADEYFQEGRNAVAGGRIYVNDIIRGDFGDDWNSFRKRAFAAGVYLTNDQSDRGVDVWNQNLSEILPGMFSPDELDGRIILGRIVQAAEEGKDEKVSLAEYTARLAGEEYVSEREILDNMERQMNWALRTFAEKADLEIKLRDRTGIKIAQETKHSITLLPATIFRNCGKRCPAMCAAGPTGILSPSCVITWILG